MDSKDIIDGIRRDLGDVTSESYVAMPKQYNLNTEFLSQKSKDAHRRLYDSETEHVTKVSAEMDSVDTRDEFRKYNLLKREEVAGLNSVYLHELYFANISDVNSQISNDSLSYMRLARDFGDFDRWQYDFVAAAMGAGNGWAVTAYSFFLRRYINIFVSGDDVSALVGCYPVVVLDCHEHAYYRDYMDDRKSYVYAMMKEINWTIIEERFKRSERIAEALR